MVFVPSLSNLFSLANSSKRKQDHGHRSGCKLKQSGQLNLIQIRYLKHTLTLIAWQQNIQPTRNSADGQTEYASLSLPPELRNNIYHMCLVEEGWIRITAALQPPPLLSTCWQIRSEALELWHYANDFAIDVQNRDTSLYQAHVDNVLNSQLCINAQGKWELTIDLTGLHWEYPMTWCHAVWAGNLLAPRGADEDLIDVWMIAKPATNIAQKARGLPWKVVESMLEELRVVAVRLDLIE